MHTYINDEAALREFRPLPVGYMYTFLRLYKIHVNNCWKSTDMLKENHIKTEMNKVKHPRSFLVFFPMIVVQEVVPPVCGSQWPCCLGDRVREELRGHSDAFLWAFGNFCKDFGPCAASK